MKVTIANTATNTSKTLQAMAEHYFDDLGVSVETQNVSDGVKLLASVVAGSTDMAVLNGFSQVFPAIEAGANLKLVCGSALALNYELYTANPDVKTIKDLEGKSVGTGAIGALLHAIMMALFKKHGIDASKVQFVNIGSSTDVFKAIAAKKVDAGPSQNDFARNPDQYGVRIIADITTELPEFTQQAGYASDKAIAEKRDALVRTLAGYGKMFRYITSPQSQADFIEVEKTIGGASEEDARYQWEWIQKTPNAYATDLILSDARINYIQQLNVELNQQKAVLPIAKVADMSLAQDAQKLLA